MVSCEYYTPIFPQYADAQETGVEDWSQKNWEDLILKVKVTLSLNGKILIQECSVNVLSVLLFVWNSLN